MTRYEDFYSLHVLDMLNLYNHNNIDIQMMSDFFQYINHDYHMDFLDKYLRDEKQNYSSRFSFTTTKSKTTESFFT